ncbi:T9SS type A sorting domain-containing protein [Lacinutrix neustonica]|uniref:T9SS type A sorting domain-containing protein n=1 Tax=Lacinutrix neustonica TaxID=2980107 RepID=A0A9E8MTH8_9FLAO|nr:T9SS type A sorting domain-containing protein [Lacinutrix neustonica]WAC01192.1 T9SS type A sorting domain-containing protein [Lacinutrix neustonica]
MAFQLEEDWDLVYMEYSINEGQSWQVLGTATDLNWYNSDTVPGSNCLNCPGAQWTGEVSTLTPYRYNLSAFATESNMMFRFVFHSDQAVAQEGVIVDNLVIAGNVLGVDEFATSNFSIFPNPSKGVFNIKTETNEAFDIEIYDVSGKIILKHTNVTPNNKQYALNMADYSAGMYFLSISKGHSKLTKKLILD